MGVERRRTIVEDAQMLLCLFLSPNSLSGAFVSVIKADSLSLLLAYLEIKERKGGGGGNSNGSDSEPPDS